jgi:hypothetical protein
MPSGAPPAIPPVKSGGAFIGTLAGPGELVPVPQTERAKKMDHSTHARIAASDLTPAMIEGAAIYDGQDNKVGTVSHVHGAGAASTVVLDVGGFLGIGSKPVAVPVSELNFMRDESGDVHAVTGWTRDRLEAMPKHHD